MNTNPADPGRDRPATPVLVLIGLAFAISLLKGLRMPNLWSATHLTFNYDLGFIRRGLVGTLLKAVGGEAIFRYQRLALISVAIFVLVVVAMSRLCARLLRTGPRDLALQGAVLVFAASPGVVFFAHEIGYLDFVGLLAVILFILRAARARRRFLLFYAAAALGIVFALIHESMMIMFAPTLLFAGLCHIVRVERTTGLSRVAKAVMVAHAGAAALIAFVASTVVGLVGTRPIDQIRALQASIARAANFPLRGDAFEALARPVKDNLHNLMPWYWTNPANKAYLANGLIATAPGLLFLFGYGMRLIVRLPEAVATRVVLAAVFVAATFGPLTLNFVGWDAARWNAICLAASFLCVATLRLLFAEHQATAASWEIRWPWMLPLAAAAVILGMATDYHRFLFDGYTVRFFPFVDQIDAAIDLIKHGFTFIPRG